MAGVDFEPLFTPFQLGNITLPNRIVLPAMGLAVCTDGVPGPGTAEYYRRRALGGAGLLMTEGVYIDHYSSGDNPVNGRFHGEARAAGWKAVAEAVHAAGSFTMPELWHMGLVYFAGDVMTGGTLRHRPELRQVSPSGYIEPGKKVSDAMTVAEIDEVIASYGRGAALAKNLGFDGVELHGAHGFLIDQFFWSKLNRRTDHYGGPARSRGRFAAEVVAECKRNLDPGTAVILRLSNWKVIDYEARLAETPQELEELLAPIVEAGIDMIDCSQRRFWEPAYDGSDLNLAGWVKKVTGKPTITIGSVGLALDMTVSLSDYSSVSETDHRNFDELMRRFDRGEFDLVAVGRAMVAEPNWARIVRSGAFDKLKPFSVGSLQEATALMQDPRWEDAEVAE